jgi:CheY-like chemotaxis protein
LPCISQVVPHVAAQALPATRQGAKRILVVDDNADAGESLAMFLKIEGHEVKAVTDALQALSCLEVFAPQVAIVDIGLPGMNGYELATAIRADKALPTPMLIALTGYGQQEDFERAREAGFDHHFVKPADLRAIQEVIHTAPQHQVRDERRERR